ncbi:unnamed protein product [Tetraodon nigroviridis]|uniref:(spotted green pufferfish) hypothetical protein n=1 Tax=Tetraodon nigroviridis TaxID=99883 RepID=Q4RTN0_TETNG|nr:unnamed protein product [Tetraodon nigroviridis]
MDFLRQFLIMVAIIACEGEELKCSENEMKDFYRLEGEAFVFRLSRVMENLHDEAFQWHKNGTQPEQIFTWEKPKRALPQQVSVLPEGRGRNTLAFTRLDTEGERRVQQLYARIHVVKSESDPKLLYGEISNSNKNMRVSCPGPIASICNNFRGNFSWKKDFILLEGNQKDWWIGNSQVDKGVYTCVCTWMHNSEVYQSTGSRKISQERQFVNIKPGILSPEGSKVPAGEGSVMKLNCTIFCGKNVPTCDAEWKMNGSPIPADGYSNETQSRVVNNSMDTFSTAVLTINKVSAKDFQATFTCTGRGLHDSTSKNIKLIWRSE